MKWIYIKSFLSAALLFSIIAVIIISGKNNKSQAVDTVLNDNKPNYVLIIDAGHGGADGGAVASDGTQESIINLSIALKIDALSRLFGINTLMTRSSEELNYPDEVSSISSKKHWDQKRRLEIINSTNDAFFLSIHQNKYPDARPSGPQVLYAHDDASKSWGELTHSLLNEKLCSHNRRLASPIQDNIYLMNNAKCPAILVECGFISNPDELAKLLSEQYQIKIAAVILSSFISYTTR